MRSTRRCWLAIVGAVDLLVAGCGPDEVVELRGLVRDGRTGAPVSGATVGHEGTRVTTDEHGRFVISVPSGERQVVARAPGRCGRSETLEVREGSPEVTLHLFERIELEPEHSQVGFGQEIRLEATLRCDSGAALRWRQTSGPPLTELRTERNGQVAVFRTHRVDELMTLDGRVQVVAFDRHQRGDYRFEVRVEVDGQEETREVRVVAGPTAAGIFQVPTGADLYLDGGDAEGHAWTLENKPDGSLTELSGADSRLLRLRPDRFGTYLISHAPSGTRMTVQAGAYEDVPNDCGREGCHRSEDQGWTTTAHARTFRRGLDGELGESFSEPCWACHATGVDPGIANGGLHHTAERFGWRQPPPAAGLFEQIPRRIRRRGSVWCSACHGPGRIVPPQFHWQYGAKFQVGVCARCHDVDEADPDSNHRSPHVDEWELSPMSRMTGGLGSQVLESGCAHCHTAQGFVAHLRSGTSVAADPVTAAAITCTVCHDPHDGTRPRGLRAYGDSAPIDGQVVALGAGAMCVTCHRSGEGPAPDASPHAPQSNVLVGSGARLVVATQSGVHREIANGCVTCHMARPPEARELQAGGHSFAVRAPDGPIAASACASCHPGVEPDVIGRRDWDGDGTEASLSDETDRALSELRAHLASAIVARRVRDRCEPARAAALVREVAGRLHLADAEQRVLGDCDDDGRIGNGETAVTVSSLPRKLGDAAYDLELLVRDGSHGRHNPRFTFDVIAALRRALPAR